MSEDDKLSASRALSRVLTGVHSARELELLIHHFASQGSLAPLETLLDDPTGSALSDGLYILSELGQHGWSLTAKVARFLNHPDDDVRFFSISCVAAAPRAAGTEAIAMVLQRLDDASKRVRWKAIDFLSAMDENSLSACREFFRNRNDSRQIGGISLVLKAGDASQLELMAAVDSPEPLERAYGIAAAVRLGDAAKSVIDRASQSADQAVSEFARSELR